MYNENLSYWHSKKSCWALSAQVVIGNLVKVEAQTLVNLAQWIMKIGTTLDKDCWKDCTNYPSAVFCSCCIDNKHSWKGTKSNLVLHSYACAEKLFTLVRSTFFKRVALRRRGLAIALFAQHLELFVCLRIRIEKHKKQKTVSIPLHTILF